jgi:hypothetical protein
MAAQGGAYYTTAKYNKANDFVKIYRAAYNRNYPLMVNMAVPPSVVDNATRTWRYNNVVANPALPAVTRNVIVRFPHSYQYEKALSVYNPAADPTSFLKRYNQLIEVEVEGQLMFSSYVYMNAVNESQPTTIRLESISPVENSADNTSQFISARRRYTVDEGYLTKEDTYLLKKEDTYNLIIDQLGNGSRRLVAENIQYIRFMGENCYPSYLWLETYQDFLLGKNQVSGWDDVTALALSVDQTEVFTRLEDTSKCKIDNQWPRYDGINKVDVPNYKQKWFDGVDEDKISVEGLQSAIKNYLTLSKDPNNLYAYNASAYTSSGPNFTSGESDPTDTVDESQKTEQEFSLGYLNMLKIVAIDYHIARMLGLAYIDSAAGNDKYIYIAVYDTNDAIDSINSAARHTYMSLPTGKTDYKLPYTPQLADIRYGLFVSMGDASKQNLTDDAGYYKYDASRAINLDLNTDGAPYYYDKNSFFIPDQEYSFADHTQPVMYGVKYHSVTDNTAWTDLSVDASIKDHNNNPEVMPLMDVGKNPIFTHMETNPGVHEYAMYAINWFGRASAWSNTRQTDYTNFKVVETFMPPQNFAVQLVQKENPNILTSASEQTRLNNLTTTDKTLVRVTFDWDDVNYSNYWYGKRARFYFRTGGVNFVRGMIKSVEQVDDNTYRLRTTSYTIRSTKPATTVTPEISTSTMGNYANSLFTTTSGQYLLNHVEQSSVAGEGPVFYIQPAVTTTATDIDLEGENVLAKKITVPQASEIFSVAENTTTAQCWSKTLSKSVYLHCLSEYTEIETNPDGGSKIVKIGGAYEDALIEEYQEKELKADGTEGFIAGSTTGIYKFTFSSYRLPSHNDNNIEWYKGKIRVQMPGNKGVRELKVVDINNDGPLIVKAVDSTYNVAAGYVPTGTYVPIPKNITMKVNFHPGYRAYLTAEDGFNESILLPNEGEETRYSYMACSAEDGTYSADRTIFSCSASSYLSSTALLVGREILTPIRPEPPKGGTYTTHPNFFGKSTYTFETSVGSGRDPYMLIFYRGTDQIILDTLYLPQTVATIRTKLAEIAKTSSSGKDEYLTSRWKSLVTMDLADGQFKAYDNSPDYHFPNPDNTAFAMSDRTGQHVIRPFNGSIPPGSTDIVPDSQYIFGKPMKYTDVIIGAIQSVFVPLTEQPVLYRYLKKFDDGYLPSSAKPVTRDIYGNPLTPLSEGYNQAPMAVRYTDNGVKKIRFTDYTIDGSSQSLLFYYAREMTNTMEVSDGSAIAGPIQLVNANPPKAPEIRKFNTQVADATKGTATGVVFQINDYPKVDNVSYIQIYRALNSADAQDIRTMTPLTPIAVGNPIADTFADLSTLPYGDPLYYRLIAIREAPEELKDYSNAGATKQVIQTVTSYPSSLMVANILDVTNPVSPTLSHTKNELTSTAALYKGVTISWPANVYNGTYNLYQMNASGTWKKLAEKTSADAVNNVLSYTLPDDLRMKTDDLATSYHYSFKVSVINSSGLVSLDENVYTI